MKRLSQSLFVVVLASAMVGACSTNVTPPKDGGAGSGGSHAGTTGSAGATAGTTGTAGATAGTTGTAGAGGAAAGTTGTAGTGGATAGTTGTAGTDGGAAGADAGAAGKDGGAAGTGGGAAGSDGGVAGADGGAALTAKATLTATTGNTIAATATFTNAAGIVTMVLTATAGCPVGMHPFHLHMNAVCGADGQAAGSHWTPKGDTGLGMLTCAADGTGTAMYVTPTAGYWTIGGDAATDLTLHAVMIHGTDGTSRIGCGVPVKQ
jgi:hypothetical protein